MSAGIPLKELACSCSAGILQGEHVLDLNHFEETSGCPRVFLTWQSNLEQVVALQMYTRMDSERFRSLLEKAQAGCDKVHEELQRILNERLRQMAIGAGSFER
jgi:exosome complex component RRP41